MDSDSTAAIVGAAGGAGATRLTVELGATLARANRSVALLDASFATQGLARHLSGRIDPDATAVLVDDASFEDAVVDHAADLPGRLAVCPARAPFERAARAKTPEAAERLQALVRNAAASFDHVLVDTPPIATNPAVAAVTAASRVALVAPPGTRGSDAVQRERARLADIGVTADVVIANRTQDETAGADAVVPESEVTDARDVPVSTTALDTEFAPAVAAAAETLFDDSLDLSFPDPGPLETHLPDALS